LFSRLSNFRGHPTHFDLTTSVRPTSGSNSFVAASSGVFHWRVLWRVRAENARKKRRRSRRCERATCEGCKGAPGGHSWFKKKYPQIMSLRAQRSNLPCRALRGTPNALNRVWEPRLLRRCAPRNDISAQSADDLPAFFAWFAYFAVGRHSSVCPPPSVVCDPRPSASSAVKKAVVGKMVGGAHPTAVAETL